MLAAWLNVPPDKIPPENLAHTNEWTMAAWKRVGEAAREDLEKERDGYLKKWVDDTRTLSQLAEAEEARADRLAARIKELEGALQLLMDVDTGPLLVTYEAQWNEAMGRASAVLKGETP